MQQSRLQSNDIDLTLRKHTCAEQILKIIMMVMANTVTKQLVQYSPYKHQYYISTAQFLQHEPQSPMPPQHSLDTWLSVDIWSHCSWEQRNSLMEFVHPL